MLSSGGGCETAEGRLLTWTCLGRGTATGGIRVAGAAKRQVRAVETWIVLLVVLGWLLRLARVVGIRARGVLGRRRGGDLLMLLLGRGWGTQGDLGRGGLRVLMGWRGGLGGAGDVQGRDGSTWGMGRGGTSGRGRSGAGVGGSAAATLVGGDGADTGIVVGVVVVVVVLGSGGGADGEAAGEICGLGLGRHGHGGRSAVHGGANRMGRGKRARGRIETGLDEILALWLGDEGLELCSGKSVYEASL